MRLNPDLFRKLLLSIEDITNGTTSFSLPMFVTNEDFADYSEDEILYHAEQIEQSGLIHAKTNFDYNYFYIRDLTPSGHKFLADIRNDTVWSRAKEDGEKIGLQGLHHFIEITSILTSEYIKSKFS